MNISQPYPNKNKWEDAELKVIKDNAGKISIDEIVELVNEVSKKVRSYDTVLSAGNKNGFKFKLVVAA